MGFLSVQIWFLVQSLNNFYFNLTGRGEKKEKTTRGGWGRLFEGGD